MIAKPDAVEHHTDDDVDGSQDYGRGSAQFSGRAGCELPLLLERKPSTEHHPPYTIHREQGGQRVPVAGAAEKNRRRAEKRHTAGNTRAQASQDKSTLG